jgi:signal transduction histidine kinase/HAMP domain-containing protein
VKIRSGLAPDLRRRAILPPDMRRTTISMRWWLALAFAAIAAVTAIAVAEVLTQRAQRVLSDRADEIATGSSVVAAREITDALARGDLPRTVQVLAAGRRLSLFVFDDKGALVSNGGSRGVDFGSDPLDQTTLERALKGARSVDHTGDGNRIVVGLPLRTPGAAALVTIAFRKDLVAESGVLHTEILRAAALAVLVGALVGLLVAILIASRLRRIAAAAAAIEAGRFDTELRPGLRDEVGALAETIDRMRGRLRESFTALEAERNRLRTLFEQLQEGVVGVNSRLEVELANRAARRIFAGAKLAEGDPLPEPWAGFEIRPLAAKLFGQSAGISQARVAPDDDRSYALVGIPSGYGADLALLVVSDVSARERREQAEREFVANAAHELRTPLTAISNAIEALQLGAKENAEERDVFLGMIDRQTTRLGRLVRALLALARAQTRQEPLQLGPVRVKPLLEQAIENLDPAENVSVEVSCPEELAALGQQDLLEQVIGNLASNSARHTKRGKIVLAGRRSGTAAVQIEITDTGPGIAPSDQERIFDRFYQSSANGRGDGFGLGLAIVREAVRALGGVVEVESLPERGTVVRVTLASAGPDTP